MRRHALALALAILVAGCGGNRGVTTGSSPLDAACSPAPTYTVTTLKPSADNPFGVDPATNPPSRLQMVVMAYGRDNPDDFVGVFVDPSSRPYPLTVGFTKDIDRHRSELLQRREQLGDVGIAVPASGTPQSTSPPSTRVSDAGWPINVVYMPLTKNEQDLLRPEVQDFLDGEGKDIGGMIVASRHTDGRIHVGVPAISDHARQLVTARFNDRVCLETVTADGPRNPPNTSAKGPWTVASAVPG